MMHVDDPVNHLCPIELVSFLTLGKVQMLLRQFDQEVDAQHPRAHKQRQLSSSKRLRRMLLHADWW
jgi:hypothetical protein